MEHRWGQRFRVHQIVRLTAQRWAAVAQLKDVSVSGAYLLTPAPPPARITWITIDFGTAQHHVLVAADVVRRSRDGFGIEWREFAPQAVSQLLHRAAATAATAAERRTA